MYLICNFHCNSAFGCHCELSIKPIIIIIIIICSIILKPYLQVLHGSNLRFELGYVRFTVYDTVSILMIVIIAVIVGVAIVVVLIALAVYGRRIHQDKLKSAEGALISLEERLKDKATEGQSAFSISHHQYSFI